MHNVKDFPKVTGRNWKSSLILTLKNTANRELLWNQTGIMSFRLTNNEYTSDSQQSALWKQNIIWLVICFCSSFLGRTGGETSPVAIALNRPSPFWICGDEISPFNNKGWALIKARAAARPAVAHTRSSLLQVPQGVWDSHQSSNTRTGESAAIFSSAQKTLQPLGLH